jgi:hypothetical protein
MFKHIINVKVKLKSNFLIFVQLINVNLKVIYLLLITIIHVFLTL